MSAAEEQQPLVDAAPAAAPAAAPGDEKQQLQAREQREAEYQEQVRQEQYRAKVAQARAPASAWKRAALLAFVFGLFWLAFRMRAAPRRSPVVHAERYSRQFKYRPAASPIVTSKLPDGRTRIRGADVDRLRAKEAAAAAAERKNPTTKQSKAAARKTKKTN
ncbi:hypothetical protein AURDEDRAFT_112609 [Auricularia subglabra TFB-10046 SS5]|nr:hypothetical protein AURDEDRAFT_112609 [Auricularia subglabra TFB-10046 SS5]